MIVDTSAVIALIQEERQAVEVATVLIAEPAPVMPAPNATECVIVLSHRYGPVGRTVFERVRQEFGIAIGQYGEAHVAIAHRAYTQFGKGRHPAALNFGDCMAYAAARLASEPLLAVGDDFTETDLHFEGPVGHWPSTHSPNPF